MIKHVVMWRLKSPDDGTDTGDSARRVKGLLVGLKDKVPGIRHLEVGINCIVSDASADVVLITTFDTIEALDGYQRHPEHVKVAGAVREFVTERRVVDYEC